MNHPRPAQLTMTAITGISLAALAGCSGSGAADPAEQFDTSAEYTDGEYTASGSYQTPGGKEAIDVEISLSGDIVTAVVVHPQGLTPTALEFETLFAEGIGTEIIGKDIDTLSVSRIAGSTLTGGGFRRALDDIRKAALSTAASSG